MHPMWVVGRREFTDIFRERTILLAIVIQIVVAGFSSFLVVGLSALADPSAAGAGVTPSVGLTTDASNLTTELQRAGASVLPFANASAANAAFTAGRIEGYLTADGAPNATGPERYVLVLPEGDLRATVTLVVVKKALESHERALRVADAPRLVAAPVVFDTQARAGSFSFVYSLLIPLLVFLPVVLAGALVADSLTEEIQRGTLSTLLVTPARASDVVLGKVLANVALAPLLAAVWLALLATNHLGVPLSGAAGIIVLATALAFLLAILGVGIAFATRDRNKAQTLYAAALVVFFAALVALPESPANVAARLAAGSADALAWTIIAALVVLAVVGFFALARILHRASARLAEG
ncbi:MAG: ABC transporter permease subunit [Thermoplasmatota archaeon]